MQPARVCGVAEMVAVFQSSPVPEDGCNYKMAVFPPRHEWFQSSPVPEDGCNLKLHPALPEQLEFQSSPVPEDGCNYTALFLIHKDEDVSILTRPGGRVQPASVCLACHTPWFQSSPVPEDGCNEGEAAVLAPARSFNPHPSRRTGATLPSRRRAYLGRCFNPHPSRRTGATRTSCCL